MPGPRAAHSGMPSLAYPIQKKYGKEVRAEVTLPLFGCSIKKLSLGMRLMQATNVFDCSNVHIRQLISLNTGESAIHADRMQVVAL